MFGVKKNLPSKEKRGRRKSRYAPKVKKTPVREEEGTREGKERRRKKTEK